VKFYCPHTKGTHLGPWPRPLRGCGGCIFFRSLTRAAHLETVLDLQILQETGRSRPPIRSSPRPAPRVPTERQRRQAPSCCGRVFEAVRQHVPLLRRLHPPSRHFRPHPRGRSPPQRRRHVRQAPPLEAHPGHDDAERPPPDRRRPLEVPPLPPSLRSQLPPQPPFS
jgi:hypothetical protein